MENMERVEQAPKSILSKVTGMAEKAAKSFYELVMNVVATKINEQDPQAARDALSYLFSSSGLNKPGSLSSMRQRLLTYKNAPQGEESLN